MSNWYRVKLTDDWVEPTRWNGYVRAASMNEASDIAVKYCPDTSAYRLSSINSMPEMDNETIQERLDSAFHPNAAILENGEIVRRGEVIP